MTSLSCRVLVHCNCSAISILLRYHRRGDNEQQTNKSADKGQNQQGCFFPPLLVASSARTILHSHLMHYYQFRKKKEKKSPVCRFPNFLSRKKPLDAAAGIQIGSLSRRGIAHSKKPKRRKVGCWKLRSRYEEKQNFEKSQHWQPPRNREQGKPRVQVFFSFLFLLQRVANEHRNSMGIVIVTYLPEESLNLGRWILPLLAQYRPGLLCFLPVCLRRLSVGG